MKQLLCLAVASVFVLGVTSCSEDGAVGPQGDTGNANVMQFDFPAFTHNGTQISFEFALSEADLESSALFCYVEAVNGFTYPLPGLVTSSFDYRTYFEALDPTTTRMFLDRMAGAGDQDFTSMRVLAVPSNLVASAPAHVDWHEPDDVKNYIQLLQQ